LHSWTQIVSVEFTLPQRLTIYCEDQVDNFMHLTPWRKRSILTAGGVEISLQMILANVLVCDWWNRWSSTISATDCSLKSE
jgi:peroxiredoxin